MKEKDKNLYEDLQLQIESIEKLLKMRKEDVNKVDKIHIFLEQDPAFPAEFYHVA